MLQAHIIMQASKQNKTFIYKNPSKKIKNLASYIKSRTLQYSLLKHLNIFTMKRTILATLFLTVCSAQIAHAKPNFTGANYSGTYVCKGNNNKVGDYQVLAKLVLNRAASRGNIGIYDFNVETENSFVYKGKAVANLNKIALTLSMTELSSSEFSTGNATIQKNKAGKFAYTNHYYEIDSGIGTYGKEHCVAQASPKAKKSAKPA